MFATTTSSVANHNFDTFGFTYAGFYPFLLASMVSFSCSFDKPRQGSCRLYAGCRTDTIQVGSMLCLSQLATARF